VAPEKIRRLSRADRGPRQAQPWAKHNLSPAAWHPQTQTAPRTYNGLRMSQMLVGFRVKYCVAACEGSACGLHIYAKRVIVHTFRLLGAGPRSIMPVSSQPWKLDVSIRPRDVTCSSQPVAQRLHQNGDRDNGSCLCARAMTWAFDIGWMVVRQDTLQAPATRQSSLSPHHT
jgi:hypothetical protein